MPDGFMPADFEQSTAPADFAAMLRRSSPERAFGFALVMHERACESGDDDRMELWAMVVDALRPARM